MRDAGGDSWLGEDGDFCFQDSIWLCVVHSAARAPRGEALAQSYVEHGKKPRRYQLLHVTLSVDGRAGRLVPIGEQSSEPVRLLQEAVGSCDDGYSGNETTNPRMLPFRLGQHKYCGMSDQLLDLATQSRQSNGH